jgi:RNA polymerase sigma factor for flagellar operon FliA
VPTDPYLVHQDLIDRSISRICRRHGLSGPEAEDFGSDVRVHFLDRDRAVLRAFQGRSSMTTYLVAVIANYLQDWRNARWGKWRPSADARRLGPLAVRLESLIRRDRLSLDEAYETLKTHERVTETRADIEALAARLPPRTGRVSTSEDLLANLPAPESGADTTIARADAARLAGRATGLVQRAIEQLPPEDRLVLRMRFDDGIRVSAIARTLGLEHKALYRRFDRILADLRAVLERAGITEAEASEVLMHAGVGLHYEPVQDSRAHIGGPT